MIERWGYEVATSADGAEALEQVTSFDPHAVITDIMMPRMDGMELIRRIKEDPACSPSIIVLTAFGGMETAVNTVHELGAFWFVEKPIKPRAFRVLLERAVAQRALFEDKERLERQLTRQGVLGKLVGRAPAMQEIFFLIRQAAPTTAGVLITGESGTGKELAARALHELSGRRDGPFIALNCAALPEHLIESELFGHEKGAFTGALARRAGAFELAHRGTLMLDEIGDMPAGLQAKLLRFLEDRRVRRLGGATETQVDVRVVAATNKDLDAMVDSGTFRADLLYRLRVLQITLPPLRDRLSDLADLCATLLDQLNSAHGATVAGLDNGVSNAFHRYRWPGNVRELRNVLERAVILAGCGEIHIEHLPKGFAGLPPTEPAQRTLAPLPSVTLSVGTTLDQAERELIEITLAHTRHNRTRAAELLGVSAKTLYNKLKEYGSEVEE
jgi:DNA-binding NtrC family response regulator